MTYIRIICFLLVVVGGLFLPLWTFVILAFLYSFFFSCYELIPLGVLIDAEFGSAEVGVWYAYTLSVSLILVFTTYAKPYLRFYQ